MTTWISYDKDLIITNICNIPIQVSSGYVKKINVENPKKLLGKKLPAYLTSLEDRMQKPHSELKVAVVCNWNAQCGISTYSNYLINSIKDQVAEIKIFSEEVEHSTGDDGEFEVERCWRRGECLNKTADSILDWNPDYIIIQHEFGIFPNAFYFMQFMQRLENIPTVVAMHSVYEHLDKIVYTSCVKNIIVHTAEGRNNLIKHGNTNNIYVIPHGCLQIDQEQKEELWNIMQSPYTLLQFGFGFSYKGVERALEAIHILKNSDSKFDNIFYTYLISDSDYNSKHHIEYYNTLKQKVIDLGIEDNVAMIRKYQSEKTLSLYLRLVKLAIYPYINNPNNTVFGASGAVRFTMAHGTPVIASESHLFDDLEGIIPRPSSAEDLAHEIDKVFSDKEYRDGIVERASKYVEQNSWSAAASMYLNVYDQILSPLEK